jgi:hypothetical protein
MTSRDRLVYAEHKDGELSVSTEPPDAPVRRCIECESMSEVTAFAKRRRARIVWSGPVPADMRRRAI